MPEDRYRRLLGISPQPRPLNHYQLLGLGELEGDAAAVRRRADAALAKLIPHVGGPDNGEALALAAEIGEAVLVLSDAARRAEYDRPIRERKWSEFTALEATAATPDKPLLASSRRRWIEAGLSLGLPWEEVYRHVDEVAARLDQAAGVRAQRPSGNVTAEEAGRIFRCLALGVEISSGKGPRVYGQLTEAGDRLGFPRPAQAEAIAWAQGLGPADWRVPLPADALSVDRERAFEFVARGALLGRQLMAADETRLQAIAVRAGLKPEAARLIVEREMGRVGAVRVHELETEAKALAASGSPLGDEPPTEEQAALAATQAQDLARRRKVVMLGILLLVGGLALVFWLIIIPVWTGGQSEAAKESVEPTPEKLLAASRAEILSRALTPAAQLVARGAMGEGSTSAERAADVRELATQSDQPWSIDALGWIARNDAATDVRLAAVEELGKFDYDAARPTLMRLLEPSQRRPVVEQAGTLLARQRNTIVANNLLGQLTSRDAAAGDLAAAVLGKMTGLELAGGSLDTSDGRQRYATLVKRWIDAGGPPAGQIWEPLPEPIRIMEMPDTGRGTGRERYEVRLVELGQKGNLEAWDRLVALTGVETSENIRQRVVDALAKVAEPQSYLIQTLLLGRVDDDHVAAILDNLSRSGAAELPKPTVRPSRLAGILWANRYRAWVGKTWPKLAAQYGEAAGPLSELVLFELAAALPASPYSHDRDAQVPLAAAETAHGDFVAASLLVFFLREGLTGDPQTEAEQALAGLGTRQAWFFLVDEHSPNERLASETEKALRGGTIKEALAKVPTYGPDPLGRYLAWQYYMRFGLAHLDRLANRQFLLSRSVVHAQLPVLVKPPTESPDLAAEYAQTLYGRLTPEMQSAERNLFKDYTAAGDEITPRLVKLIGAGK
jgi:hypothetical protein